MRFEAATLDIATVVVNETSQTRYGPDEVGAEYDAQNQMLHVSAVELSEDLCGYLLDQCLSRRRFFKVE